MENKKQNGIWILPDIDSPKVRDFALVFLIVMFLVYDVLFYLAGKELNKAEDATTISNQDISYKKENKEYRRLVSGHPIEKMVPYISKQNGQIASFMLAIAKKESNWGLYAPKKDGKDCYNYWGYRGTYNQTDSGYSCFDSPRQAVAVIGARIENLIAQQIDTPKEMVVWKCGWNCRGQNRHEVNKWIKDVGMYVDKVNDTNS